MTTDFEDIAGWDVQVTADDTNEALKIEFMGNDSDAANYATKVSIVGRYTEVRQ